MGQLEICTGKWGRDEILRNLPAIKLVRDAIYIPWSEASNYWGVFDCNGREIFEALNYRNSDFQRSGPLMRFFDDAGSSAKWHETEAMIYGGALLRHYGHLIVNSIPRFWPALQKSTFPFICHFEGSRSFFDNGVMADLLAPIGVNVKDILEPSEAVRIKKLYVPATAFHEQMAVHTVLGDMGECVARAYDPAKDDKIPFVYLSKSRLQFGVGKFVGEEVIEKKMQDFGAKIVHPQLLDVKEQIRLLSRAEVIVGTVGSALHTTLFARRGRKVVALNANTDVNTNFLLIDKICKTKATYLFSRNVQSRAGKTFLTDHLLTTPNEFADNLVAYLADHYSRQSRRDM